MTLMETDSHGNPTVYMSDGFFFKNYKVFVEYDYPEPGTRGLIDAQVVRIEYADGHVSEWPRRFIPKEYSYANKADNEG